MEKNKNDRFTKLTKLDRVLGREEEILDIMLDNLGFLIKNLKFNNVAWTTLPKKYLLHHLQIHNH